MEGPKQIINAFGASLKNYQEKEARQEELKKTQNLHRKSLPLDWIQRLFVRFSVIWGNKWTAQVSDDDYFQVAVEEWGTALYGIEGDSIASALDQCKMTLEWPPSIAQFISFCEKEENIPSWEDALQLAIRNDFCHPTIKLAYDSVGSWDMSHDTEKVLTKKFKSAFNEAKRNYRQKKIEERLRLTDESK